MKQTADSAMQEFPMKKFISVLFFSLFSSLALAQTPEVPSDAHIAELKAGCEKRYVGMTTGAVLARSQCELALSITVLEYKERIAESDKNTAVSERAEIKKDLATQRMLLDSIEKSMKAIAAAAKATPPKPAEPQAQPAATVQTNVAPPPQQPWQQMPRPMYGAPFQVVEVPGRDASFTRDLPTLVSRYEIVSIQQAGFHFLEQQEEIDMRVVVMKNGQPIAVSNPSPECADPHRPYCFTEFYADLNHDGVPDPIPYKGIDPSFVNTIYVPTEPGERIELVYLTAQVYRKVAANGFPYQTFWGHPKKVTFHVHKSGRFAVSAYAATEQ